MNVKTMCASFAVVSLLALSAQAQPTAGEIARIYLSTPKPGGSKAYEAGRMKHMAWHKAQNDTWAWFTWEIVTGERAGSYYTATFMHEWKEFDARAKFDAADEADAAVNLDPVTGVSVPMLYRYLTKASRGNDSVEPAAFSQLTFYTLRPDGVGEFNRALASIKTALDKINWPVRANWYALVSGGEGPQYVVAVDRASWADFAPTEKSLEMAVAEATSIGEANALFDAIRKNTTKLYTEVIRYRSDLSYLPRTK